MSLEEVLEKNRNNDIYFFGAGGVFQTAVERHREILSQMRVKGVFDNASAKWGNKAAGYEVLPLEKLQDCDQNALMIITSSYVQEIRSQLLEHGFRQIYSYQELTHIGRMFSEDEVKKLESVKGYLADNKSKEVIDAIVQKRRKGECDFSDICEENQYFAENLVHVGENEVFVDGGAYIGDTIEVIIKKTGNKFSRIYAFEPEASNYEKLKEQYGCDGRIRLVHAGLGRSHQELYFIKNEKNREAGRVAEYGEESIIIENIDDYIQERVSFIKLDVEGFEMDTLRGAEKTILLYKPTLAICLYHKAEDLYEIPQYIHSLAPEYKLYVRHHSKGVAETVLYAIALNKPLIIFGAGSGAVKVIRTMKCLGVKISALTDNNPAKWGTICEDLPVLCPDELKDTDCDIMIASVYQEQIEEQLKAYGIFDRLVLKEMYIQRYIEEHLDEFKYLNMSANEWTIEPETIILGLEEGMWLGGVENLTFMWARELKKRGKKVWIFSKETEDLPPEDLKENVRYFDLDYNRYWDSVRELTEALAENLPCVVIDNWENQILQAVSIIKRFCPEAIRCISFIHNDQYLFYRRTAFMEKYIHAIAGVSLDVVKHLRDDFGIDEKKLFYKESPVEFEEDLNKSYTIDVKQPIKIGYAARITKTQKRADLLVPLIEELERLQVYYQLEIAGIGDYYERLQQELSEKKLLDHVKLLGWVNRFAMKDFWRDKDVFFNISDYEGVGLSMLEAMSFGAVPVVTDVAGAAEFVTKENGYICNCRDVEAIADCIRELDLNRDKLRVMGEKSRLIIQRKCSKKDYIDYIQRLYENR